MKRDEDVTVREMSPHDLEAILAIERQAYEFPWNRNVFETCFRAGYEASVMELDGVIIGYAVMLVAAREGHVLNFCIAADFRRRGYGLLLLKTILGHARQLGVEQFIIEVRPSNRAALSLYKKEGFQEVGLRKGYYPTRDKQREDALIFQWSAA